MKEATKRLSALSESESLRMIEEAREKARRDEVAKREYALETGMEQGRAEGMEKGRAEGMKEVAVNLLKKDTDISFISEITGLSKAEIENLKNNQ